MMITYPDACKLAVDYLGKLDIQGHVVDAQTVEHDWGWELYWDFNDKSQIPPRWATKPRLPFVVDRATGGCIKVGNTGPKIAIFHLLELRDSKLGSAHQGGSSGET